MQYTELTDEECIKVAIDAIASGSDIPAAISQRLVLIDMLDIITGDDRA